MTDQIESQVKNGVGLLTLNRPKAINSLTYDMITAMTAVLSEWEADDAVRAVVLSGSGERGLCAGGDVVAVHDSAKVDGVLARRFFRDEYVLNAQIARFPKPYVAVMDGIVMGGGVGVGGHANIRVVTDTSKVAMPEVGIGFIPDVGGTYLLSRAPGQLGLHAGLTGAPFSGADAIALGFADYYVPHDRLEKFVKAIVDSDIATALAVHSTAVPVSDLLGQSSWIDECYAGDTVADIVAALQAQGGERARAAADQILTRSPIALSVTLAAVRRARDLPSLEAVLTQEYRVSSQSVRSHDLVEGIRAQLVDKDRNPQWEPKTLAAVTEADVDAFFQPVSDDLEWS
ncbi:MAG: enoyl-CoA hydratase/isomerase family protein [Mycobacterium sp.]